MRWFFWSNIPTSNSLDGVFTAFIFVNLESYKYFFGFLLSHVDIIFLKRIFLSYEVVFFVHIALHFTNICKTWYIDVPYVEWFSIATLLRFFFCFVFANIIAQVIIWNIGKGGWVKGWRGGRVEGDGQIVPHFLGILYCSKLPLHFLLRRMKGRGVSVMAFCRIAVNFSFFPNCPPDYYIWRGVRDGTYLRSR